MLIWCSSYLTRLVGFPSTFCRGKGSKEVDGIWKASDRVYCGHSRNSLVKMFLLLSLSSFSKPPHFSQLQNLELMKANVCVY